MDDLVIRLQECAKRANPTDDGEKYGLYGMCLDAAQKIEVCRRDAGFWEMFAKNRTEELEQSRKERNQLQANLAAALTEAASWEQQASDRTDDVLRVMQERDEWKKRADAAEKDAARWREARKFLAVEDVNVWYGDEWKGHQPTEFESLKTDSTIDAAMENSES